MRRLVRWRGRSSREAAVRRARHLRAQLGVAADIAITAQRKALAIRLEAAWREETGAQVVRGRVGVDDVLEYARQHFGLASVPREQAAAALRTRYELRGGHRDLDTDAYSGAAPRADAGERFD